jgi:hypothetical protein
LLDLEVQLDLESRPFPSFCTKPNFVRHSGVTYELVGSESTKPQLGKPRSQGGPYQRNVAITHVWRHIHGPLVIVNDRKFRSECGLFVVCLDPGRRRNS